MEYMKRLALILAALALSLASCTNPDEGDDKCMSRESGACGSVEMFLFSTWDGCSGSEDSARNDEMKASFEEWRAYCESSDYCFTSADLDDCLTGDWSCTSDGFDLEVNSACDPVMGF